MPKTYLYTKQSHLMEKKKTCATGLLLLKLSLASFIGPAVLHKVNK